MDHWCCKQLVVYWSAYQTYYLERDEPKRRRPSWQTPSSSFAWCWLLRKTLRSVNPHRTSFRPPKWDHPRIRTERIGYPRDARLPGPAYLPRLHCSTICQVGLQTDHQWRGGRLCPSKTWLQNHKRARYYESRLVQVPASFWIGSQLSDRLPTWRINSRDLRWQNLNRRMGASRRWERLLSYWRLTQLWQRSLLDQCSWLANGDEGCLEKSV